MAHVLYRRLVAVVPLLLSISVVVFLLVALIPGDVAEVLAGPDATRDQVEAIRQEIGLDRPLPVRYVLWLSDMVRADFGNSVETGKPVIGLLVAGLRNTLILTAAAMALAVLLGVAAGVVSAVRRHSGADRLVMLGALFGNSMPTFWLGLVLIILFSFKFKWLPSGGMYSVRDPETLKNLLMHLILPAVTLATIPTAVIARVTRSSMLDVVHQDYITVARAKGLPQARVVWRHALKNALLPVITIMGLQFGHLMGGAVITETIFSWPGLGLIMHRAILVRDFPLIQGGVLVVATMFVLINLLVDVAYMYLDPRIHYR